MKDRGRKRIERENLGVMIGDFMRQKIEDEKEIMSDTCGHTQSNLYDNLDSRMHVCRCYIIHAMKIKKAYVITN